MTSTRVLELTRNIRAIGLAAAIATLLAVDPAAAQTHVFGDSYAKQSRVRTWQRDTSRDYVGKKATEFAGLNWLNCKPISLNSLRGKNVLLSFWHGDCCYCNGDIDGLRYLHRTYGPKGLVVIAIHDSSRSKDKIKTLIREWQVDFPVALDGNWDTAKQYQFTNCSDFKPGYFLIDPEGVITRLSYPFNLYLPERIGGLKQNPEFDSLELAINDALNPHSNSSAPSVKANLLEPRKAASLAPHPYRRKPLRP